MGVSAAESWLHRNVVMVLQDKSVFIYYEHKAYALNFFNIYLSITT